MKKEKAFRVFDAITKLYLGEKLSRKEKLLALQRKKSKSQLSKMIKAVHLEPDGSVSRCFCPYCGCFITRSTGNMVEYPEHFEKFYCMRCNENVGWIDNSRFIHILEFLVPVK